MNRLSLVVAERCFQSIDVGVACRLQSGDVPEYRLEKRYIHKDGHEVWGDATVSSMWASGSAPGYHIAVVQDITARKRMEENLRANEQRLRSILERLPMGLCLVQHDGLISFRNARYVQICGYTQEEVPDTNTWWQRAYPDATEREAIRQRLLDTLHQGIIPLAEYTIRCADGKYKPVEISGILVEGGRLITMQDLSERKAAEEEINQLAYYDPLTRLPNRRLLMDRLQQALAASARHHRSGALLMLDLDNFKTVNETRGHDRGDALLLQVAHRLRSCVHEDDTVARQGGDEFTVLLPGLSERAPIERIAEGIIEKIAPEDFKKLGEVVTDEHGHIRYSELDFGEILKQAVLAEVKKIGIKVSIIDKEIGYELRCTAPIAYDIDYARSLGYSAVQFLMAGDSGALITIQDNKAIPMRFEDIKDPATGKTKVRKVNIESVHYKIARGLMMRLEEGDLDDPGLANAYRMTQEEFHNRYAYLFPKPETMTSSSEAEKK